MGLRLRVRTSMHRLGLLRVAVVVVVCVEVLAKVSGTAVSLYAYHSVASDVHRCLVQHTTVCVLFE